MIILKTRSETVRPVKGRLLVATYHLVAKALSNYANLYNQDTGRSIFFQMFSLKVNPGSIKAKICFNMIDGNDIMI